LPTAFTVGVHVVPPAVIPGPVHEQVAPAVDEDPARLVVGLLQVNVIGTPAFAFGGILFANTVIVSEAEHPAEVTVKVYKPGAFTVGVSVAPPDTTPGPVQLYVAPGVVVDPLKMAVKAEHDIEVLEPALAFVVPGTTFT